MAQSPNFFSNFNFPEYEYREYPMWVTLDGDGHPTEEAYNPKKPGVLTRVQVRDYDELMALQAGEAEIGSDQMIRTEDDERADLYTAAAQAGAKIDKRWTVEKIRQAIDEHVSGGHVL